MPEAYIKRPEEFFLMPRRSKLGYLQQLEGVWHEICDSALNGASENRAAAFQRYIALKRLLARANADRDKEVAAYADRLYTSVWKLKEQLTRLQPSSS